MVDPIKNGLTTKAERSAAFRQIRAQVEKEVKPINVFDQMLVDDIAYHFCQQQKLRTCADNLPIVARRKALEHILQSIISDNHKLVETYVDVYFGNEVEPDEDGPFTKADVVELLRQYRLDESAIDTVAVELSLGTLTLLEDLSLRHEIRRGDIIREVERRRAQRPERDNSRPRQPKALAPPKVKMLQGPQPAPLNQRTAR
jgi:hypothetical protein